jgi:hypothetical protein
MPMNHWNFRTSRIVERLSRAFVRPCFNGANRDGIERQGDSRASLPCKLSDDEGRSKCSYISGTPCVCHELGFQVEQET